MSLLVFCVAVLGICVGAIVAAEILAEVLEARYNRRRRTEAIDATIDRILEEP